MEDEKLKELLSLLEMVADNGGGCEKIPVGKVTEQLRLRVQNMNKNKENLEHEMESRKNILKAEMELKLYQEFSDRANANQDEKDDCWEEIAKELNLDTNKSYSINHKQGIVSEKIKKQSTTFGFPPMDRKRRK